MDRRARSLWANISLQNLFVSHLHTKRICLLMPLREEFLLRENIQNALSSTFRFVRASDKKIGKTLQDSEIEIAVEIGGLKLEVFRRLFFPKAEKRKRKIVRQRKKVGKFVSRGWKGFPSPDFRPQRKAFSLKRFFEARMAVRKTGASILP